MRHRHGCGHGGVERHGLALDDVPFVHESIVGTPSRARLVDRLEVAERPAMSPEIEGSAWVTGEHTS